MVLSAPIMLYWGVSMQLWTTWELWCAPEEQSSTTPAIYAVLIQPSAPSTWQLVLSAGLLLAMFLSAADGCFLPCAHQGSLSVLRILWVLAPAYVPVTTSDNYIDDFHIHDSSVDFPQALTNMVRLLSTVVLYHNASLGDMQTFLVTFVLAKCLKPLPWLSGFLCVHPVWMYIVWKNIMITLSLRQVWMRPLFTLVNRFLRESQGLAHLGKYLGTQLLCCIMDVWFYKTLPVGLTDVSTSFCIITSSKNFHCCTTLPAFGIVRLWNFSHSHRYTVVPHCCFL